jgi:ABC-2 type transport system ATP-binding protein
MLEGHTIEVRGLTKRFGPVAAVSDLTFEVPAGAVTGFLGPNGAGKTTTLRMLLGLVEPTAGTATFGGVRYRDLPRPIASVGTALEAASFHPGRTARNHLRVMASAGGIPAARVDTVLGLVGLGEYGDRRVGGYSLGMRQRLGLAGALLGDPGVLVLDEPVNGLDPEGIRWIRTFLRDLAGEGRTVLVSSHLLSEVQQSVDRVVIIASGRLVYEGTLEGLDTSATVIADAQDRVALGAAIRAAGGVADVAEAGLSVTGIDASAVGAAALAAGVPLSLLMPRQGGLEQSFLDIVGEGGSK